MSDEMRKPLLEGAEDIRAYGGIHQFQVCDCGNDRRQIECTHGR